ncbi:MAG: hypothetical protein RLZZ58_2129 [Pseudomonadota bacterium]
MNNPLVSARRTALHEQMNASPMPTTALILSEADDNPIVEYLSIFRRRIWWIIGAIVAACAFAFYLTMTTIPLYRATTVIEVSRETARVLKSEDAESGLTANSLEFYQTQYGLLASQKVAAAASRKLRLADNPTFMLGYAGGEDNGVMRLSRQDRQNIAVKMMKQYTLIEPVRNSGLVNVRFDSPNAELSAQISGAIAEAFIETNLQRRFEANSYAREFLEKELDRVRTALEDSERRVADYAGRNDIIEVNRVSDKSGTTQGQAISELSLEVLNNQLAQAKGARIAAAAKSQAQGQAAVLNDGGIQAMQAQRATLQAEYSKNLSVFKPDYPTMVALRDQMASLDRSISQQSGRISQAARGDYAGALQQERQLEAQVEGLKQNVQDLGQRRIQYGIYQRDADTNRALYNSLLERYKEVGVAGGVGTNNVSIVDAAEAPGGPFVPRPFTNFILALMAGTIAGFGLAMLMHQLDGALKNPADIESNLGLPMLGVIPRDEFGDLLATLSDRKSVLSESYQSVLTSLRFSTTHGVPRSLAVTSANASEGKSTTALSVATILARMGRKVLIIDADMRNPSLHKLIGVTNSYGVANLLAGDAVKDIKPYPIGPDGLLGIPAGPIPPNPAELLGTDRLGEVLEELLGLYDHVIVDAPPVMGLSDSPLISSTVEAVVFVVTAGATGKKSAVASLRRLQEAGANLIGAVLSRYASSQAGYGYSYNYTYSYGAENKPKSKGSGLFDVFRKKV